MELVDDLTADEVLSSGETGDQVKVCCCNSGSRTHRHGVDIEDRISPERDNEWLGNRDAAEHRKDERDGRVCE